MNSCVPIFISASASPEPSLQQLVPELGCSEETHYIWYTSIYKKYPEQALKKKKVNIFTSFQAGEGSINTLFLQGDPSVHVQMDEKV